MGDVRSMRYEFQSHSLDVQRRELLRDGRLVPIARKPFLVLQHLLEHRDRLVLKRELLETFWPRMVSENVLQSTIRQIRMAVGDDGRSQGVIRTYHGEGFRFVAPVSVAAPKPPASMNDVARPDEALDPQPAPPRLAEGPMPPPIPGLRAATLDEHRLSAVLACRLSVEGMGDGRRDDSAVDAVFEQAKRLVARHGGRILHRMPDGFTAVFGAAVGAEKGTRLAYDCARDLAVAAVDGCLHTAIAQPRFGLDAGRFPVLAAGNAVRMRAVQSRVLKSALALADGARQQQVALSDRAASHLGPEIRRRRTATGGVPLLRTLPGSGAPAGSVERGFADFVGRKAEMAVLTDTLARAASGRGEMVLLCGEAGIGKSRLLAEFLALAAARGCPGLTLLCDPRERNTPMAMMTSLARSIGATPGAADAAECRKDPVEDALWRDLTGGGADAAVLAALSPHVRRQRTFRVLRARLARLAARGPMVLAIEDAHWLDATSRDFLDHLGRTIDGLAVMTVVTSRPEPGPAPVDAPLVTTLRLPPLEQADGLKLVRCRSGVARLRDDDARSLVDRAAGNPLFLEQLLVAVEGGADPRRGLPDTVQEVIAVRLGRLSARARALLLATAVIGPQARRSVMAGAVTWDETELDAALAELLDAGVLVEDMLEAAGTFRFRHILLQDVAYDMLAPQDRQDLHGRIARILAEAGADAEPERLAWHHQEAGETTAAVAQWTQAARMAQWRSASREAVAFGRNGLRLLQAANDRTDVGQELELQLTLAPALAATMGYGSDEVGVAYRRARDLSRSAGTPRSEFRILVGLWNYAWVRGDLAQAHGYAGELLALAANRGDPTLQLRAHACMGEILFHMGDFPAAAGHLDTACRLFADSAEVRAATRVPAVACHCYAAWTASFLGRPAEARAFCDAAGGIADALLQPFSMALNLALKAELLLFEGEILACRDTAREAAALSLREGFPFWHGTALVNLGWAEAHAGNPAEGLARLQQGISIFESTGARVQLANWYGLLAEVLHLIGDRTAALTACETAAGWARRTGDRFFLPRIERTLADLDPAP